MKKGQIYEGVIEKVEFLNKGIVPVESEGRKVIVKNGIPYIPEYRKLLKE